MDWEEAEEYFEYNTIGAWVGEQTPIFVDVVEKRKAASRTGRPKVRKKKREQYVERAKRTLGLGPHNKGAA